LQISTLSLSERSVQRLFPVEIAVNLIILKAAGNDEVSLKIYRPTMATSVKLIVSKKNHTMGKIIPNKTWKIVTNAKPPDAEGTKRLTKYENEIAEYPYAKRIRRIAPEIHTKVPFMNCT